MVKKWGIFLLTVLLLAGCSSKGQESQNKDSNKTTVQATAQTEMSNTGGTSAATNSSTQTNNLEQQTASSNSNTNAPSPAQSKEYQFNTYTNGRYAFEVQYPNTFDVSDKPTNDDGRSFYNMDCTITAFGSWNQDKSIDSLYQEALSQAPGSIAYKQLGGDWYAYSFQTGEKIVYTKAIMKGMNIYTLKIEYPSSQKGKYDTMVTHVSNTFKPGIGK